MRVSAFIALSMLFTCPAIAQDSSNGHDGEEIVVTGSRQREKEVADFVNALSDPPASGTMGRIDRTTACPASVGLSQERNADIVARIRRVAEAVGIPVAEESCRPNILVVFTRDKKEFIDGLRNKSPIFFKDAAGRQIDLSDQKGPATAWHMEGRLDFKGAPLTLDRDGEKYEIDTTYAPVRTRSPFRQIFLGAVVVVELDAVVGLTTTHVADDGAMGAFAEVHPSRLKRTSAPTILTVLEAPMDPPVPLTLTQWDMSYLKGLYATGEYNYARQQRGEIRTHMMKEMEQTQERAE